MKNSLGQILVDGVNEEKIRIDFMTSKKNGRKYFALDIFDVDKKEKIYGVTVSHNGKQPRLSDILKISIIKDSPNILERK